MAIVLFTEEIICRWFVSITDVPATIEQTVCGHFGHLAKRSNNRVFTLGHKWSGRRLCSLSAKDARRNRDSAVPDLLCDVSKQQLAVLRERATQLLQLGGVSILLLFQVP